MKMMNLNDILKALKINPKGVITESVKEYSTPEIRYEHSYFTRITPSEEKFEIIGQDSDWKYVINIKRYK